VVDREETLNKKIEHEHICSIMELNDGRILLATQAKGVFFVNPKTKEVLTISDKDGLPSYCVNDVCSDGRNGIWLGTYEGLAHIDDIRHPQQIETYDHRQGLKDNHIRALQCDRSGRVWLSTFTGISCFDPIKKRFYNYSHTDNLPSGSFISGSCATASDGTMFFASPNGVCFFNPQMLSHEQKVSEVQIVGLEAYNPAGEDTEIQHLVPNDKGYVYTTYKQNTLHITFGVKDFSQSGRVEYSYLMKGLNDEWYYIDNDDDVVFRGLRPGNYTFILRAKLKSQDWEDASTTEINIRIKPPFWRTWWAYLLYILVLGAIVWFLTDIYKRKLHLESSLELEKRDNMQKEELNEERLRFFTNITHELRTPLTLILGPLEDLINDRQLSDNYHKKLEVINKNAGRLRDLINQILEFRKTETQNRQLTVAKGDLGALVNEIGQFYKQLNRNPHVAVNIHISDDVPPVYYDSEVITSIINNLMSNAVKYTEEGFINLSLTQDQQQQQTVITVEDSGYGIDPASLPYIFDRYYQVKGEHQASGTGIGLALVKSLADLHQGTLSVDSRLGEGAKFTFSILTDNTYPNALHKEDPEEDDKQETDMLEVIETDTDQRPVLLVVEDNSDIRQYIANSLGDDFQILQAADGAEGLDLAHVNIPDIIVSDIMMPKMNGIELTRKLKDDINTSHIPIILLTAKDTVDDKLEGYESGADSYITKPFSSRLLQSRINNLLANRRRLSEIILNRKPDTITAEPSQSYVADDEPHLSRLDRVFIEKMNRVIQEHIDTENLDMAFMTDKMAMSHSTFYRKVKALTGMTAKEYIRKIRLQRCAELLASGDYNVSEAASMIGFNDLGHFREVFKKEFGVAPSEYSKRNG
ncbi:MAG: response regulator, partial [Prevotella sp.]|nr:response regulator [Prevotella sp.]